MTQVADFTINIQQVKKSLEELAALEKQIFSTVPKTTSYTAPPPPAVPANLSANPSEALNQMARMEGAYRASIARLQEQGVLSSGQAGRLKTEASAVTAAAAGGSLPFLPGKNANLATGGFTDEEMRAAARERRNIQAALSRKNTGSLDDAAFQERMAVETARGLKAQEGVTSAIQLELLTEEQIAEAQNARNIAIRKQIVKLESELGLPVTQGGAVGTPISDLATYKSNLTNDRKIVEAQRAAIYQNSIRSLSAANGFSGPAGFARLTGNSPANFAPTAALQADAKAEATEMAARRSIAVAYGQAKQAAYYDQIRYNNVFRAQFAEEAALREARLGVEKQLVAEELARPRGPGGRRLRDDVVAGKVADTKETAIQTADVSARLAADEEYVAAKAKAALAHQEEAAAILAANAADPAYIAAKIRNIEAQSAESIAISAATTEKTIQLQAQAAAGEALTREQFKAAEFEALSTREALQVKAQRIIAEKEYNLALNKAIASQLAANGASKFQQTQALQGHYRGGGNPQDAAGLFGGGLINTVKYAVPSLLLFGAAAGLGKSIKEAQELQKIFAQIDAQAESLGQTAGVQHLKDQILSIAAASGTASPEVANLAFQFQGAFGGDTERTIRETASAIEAVVVTGLTLKETTDAFTALTQSFKDQDVTIAQVSDTALGLQERFGVLAKETISFAADLAPVGAQIGLTVQELETLGAVAQKYSGKSGTQLADSFGRIFPAIQKNAVEVIGLFESVGAKDVGKQLTEAFATGNTGEAFKVLGESYSKLTQAQQNLLIAQLGGRREAQALIPVLEHYDEFVKSSAKGLGDAGKTTEYYTKVQETLSRQLAILGENLKQIGISIFSGGLGQALGLLVESARGIIEIFGGVFKVVSAVNNALGGIPGTALSVLAVIRLLAGGVDIAATAFTRLFGAKTLDTEATIANNAASSKLAVTQAQVAGTTTAESGAAGAGFFGSIIAGTRGNYAALRGGAIASQNAALASIVPGGVGGLVAVEKESAGLAGRMAITSQATTRAGQGFSAFANALPGPLVWAGLVLSIGLLVAKVNEIRGAASEQEEDLKKRILGLSPTERAKALKGLEAQGSQFSAQDSGAAAISGYTNPTDLANNIRRQLEAPGIQAQLQAIQELAGSGVGKDRIPSGSVLLGGKGDGSGEIDAFVELQNAIKELKADPTNLDKLQNAKNFIDLYKQQFGGTDIGNGNVNDLLGKYYDGAISAADEEAKKNADNKAKAKDLQEKFNNLTTDIATIKSSIASGDLSIGEGLSQVNNRIKIYEDLKAVDPNALAAIEGAEAKYREGLKFRAQLISGAAYQQVQNQTKFNDLSGITDPTANVQALEEVLRGTDLDPADRQKATEDLINGYKALYDFKLKNATSLEEQTDLIKNGIKVAPEARLQVIKNQLDTAAPLFQKYISEQDIQVQEVLGGSSELIARLMLFTGGSVKQATVLALKAQAITLRASADAKQKIVDAKIAEGKTSLDDLAALGREIEDIRGKADKSDAAAGALDSSSTDLGGVNTFDAVRGKDEDNRKAAAERRKAQASYYKALNEGDSVAQAQIELQSAQADLADTVVGTKEWLDAAAAVASANNGLKNALQERSRGRFDYLKALAGDDPIAQAQIDLQSAAEALAQSTPDNLDANKAAFINAQNGLRKANDDLTNQRLDYEAALVSGDPIKAATAAQHKADVLLSQATTESQRIIALTAKLNADRAAKDALSQLFEAQANLLKASLNYLGDSVGVANIGVAEAQRILAETQAKALVGEAGEADIANAKATLKTAVGSQRDAIIAKKKDDYAFQYEMKQITLSQYIQYLEGLKSLADGNLTIIRDLDRQIKGLKDSLGADLQFNLPTNIGLPTLYEARRLNQSSGPNGQPAGYQDNRNVQINIQVNNGMDLKQVQTVLGDALGGGRTGNLPRRY